jgi:hypothetical protein
MTLDNIIIIIAGISTLAIFSFLVKENPIFRFFEHIFIGISAGYIPLVTIKTFLYPEVIKPILDGQDSVSLLLIIPVLIGLFYYAIYIPRLQFLSRIAIGITLGAASGLAFQGFFAEITPQITSSFKNLTSFDGLLFVTILVSTLYYFFFTIERHGAVGKISAVYARCWMMVCFGAFFGSTVTARLALLVERVKFLNDSWLPVVKGLFHV